jgi:hypothetical protein
MGRREQPGLFRRSRPVQPVSRAGQILAHIVAFAAACALGSAYGFLQGAWPFGAVKAIWAGVAVHRWCKKSEAYRLILSIFA